MPETVKPQTQTKHCETHGEYEVAGLDFGDGEIKFLGGCPGCVAEADSARERMRAEEDRWRMERKLRQLQITAGIPQRFADRTLDNFRADNDGQRKAVAVCRRFLTTDKPGVSLIFSGRPGTGKTHLACAIAGELVEQGRVAMFRTVRQAIRHVKQTYHRDCELTEAEAIQALTDADLLILDEVGVQLGTEHELMLLFEIINERYQQMRSTILLTNLTGDELTEYLGDRVLDRFREGGAVVAFDWPSHRGQV